MLDGNEIIALLSNGDVSALDRVYIHYKPGFLKWAGQKFTDANKQDLVDTWHDTVIVFYDQVISARLKNVHCDLKTYLFTIGFRLLIKKYKKSKAVSLCEEVDEKLFHQDIFTDFEQNSHEDTKWLLDAIQELPATSRKLLMLRFIDGMSLRDIASKTEYGSLNSLSATISRSLKRLKELVQIKMEERKHGG